MKKYRVVFKNAAEGQLRNPVMLLMRLLFLSVLVFATQKLWQAIGHKGFDPVNIVWYLVMNELLFFSYDERLLKRIVNDIRSGNIAYSLIRPFSYLTQCVVEGMGVFCARLPVLLLLGSAMAFAMTGAFPATFHGIGCIFFLMILSGIFMNFCLVSIGLLALYMQSPNSVYLVWQKMMFVFGGLFFPLTVYPQWLVDFSHKMPFPYILYEISRLIYEFSWPIVLNTAAALLFWICIAFLFSRWLFSALLRKVSVNGG